MRLSNLHKKFNARCFGYQARSRDIEVRRNSLKEWEFNYLTEVLLSDVWQSWCKFNRNIFLISCRGTIARNGDVIPSIGGDKTWQRLCYQAKQKAYGRNCSANGHLNFAMRKEPTWGDLDVFIQIISGVAPSNHATLMQAYGSFSSLKELQLVRNSCAHKNVETLTEVELIQQHYLAGRTTNPTEAAWRFNPIERLTAFELWLYEMRKISDLATESG